MAYASKYYDPVKAHEYYERTKELKGYENRYGGSRGNGTSAASGGSMSSNSTAKTPEQKTKEHNQNLQRQIQSINANSTKQITSINSQISDLRNKLKSMSKDEKKANRESINAQIQGLRNQIQAIRDKQADDTQALREKQKGGSTAGFNQKGKEAAAYIKKQMEAERDEVTKKANKEVDDKMLSDAKRLQADIQAMRASGRGFSRQQFRNRLKKLTGEAKRTKAKALAARKKEYAQKYKDEIDKLRQDKSMYSYYDRRAKKYARRAAREAAKKR